MVKSPQTSSVSLASQMFNIPVRKHGNFATAQAKFVHLLRLKVNELQRPYSDESDIFYDKMAFKENLVKSRLRTPGTYAFIREVKDFDSFWKRQLDNEDIEEFVIKPNHLSQGRHVYVLKKNYDEYLDPKRPDDGYIPRYTYTEIDGTKRNKKYFREVAKSILHGHRIGGLMMEEVIHSHPDYTKWQGNPGIADLRAYVLYDSFLYGKLRLPTKKSSYYGNTGRNAFACFVNSDGVIDETDLMDNVGIVHPDTKINLKGEKLPFWDKMYSMIISVAKLFRIPFHSVDLTIEENGMACCIESERIPYLSHFTKRGALELKQKMDDITKR